MTRARGGSSAENVSAVSSKKTSAVAAWVCIRIGDERKVIRSSWACRWALSRIKLAIGLVCQSVE